MTDPTEATTPEQAELDQQIAQINASPLRGDPAIEARRTALYQRRYPPSDGSAPAPTPALDALRAEREALRQSPEFQRGDAQAQADVEAMHQAEHGDDAESSPAPVRVDWGPGEVSESDQMVRGTIESLFGRIGVSESDASWFLGQARAARDRPLSDEDRDTLTRATETTLRQRWGADYDSKIRVAYHVADRFEEGLGPGHPDIDRAIDGGLWLNPDVLERLAALGDRRGVLEDAVSVRRVRAELLRTNEGSPRYRELTQALESGYRRLYGR